MSRSRSIDGRGQMSGGRFITSLNASDVIAMGPPIGDDHVGNIRLYKLMKTIQDVQYLYRSVEGRFVAKHSSRDVTSSSSTTSSWRELSQPEALSFIEQCLNRRRDPGGGSGGQMEPDGSLSNPNRPTATTYLRASSVPRSRTAASASPVSSTSSSVIGKVPDKVAPNLPLMRQASAAISGTIMEEETARLTKELDKILSIIMPDYALKALRPVDMTNACSAFLKVYARFHQTAQSPNTATTPTKKSSGGVSEHNKSIVKMWDTKCYLGFVETDETLGAVRGRCGFSEDTLFLFNKHLLSKQKPVWVCMVLLGKEGESFRSVGDGPFNRQTHGAILSDPHQCIPLLHYVSWVGAVEGAQKIEQADAILKGMMDESSRARQAALAAGEADPGAIQWSFSESSSVGNGSRKSMSYSTKTDAALRPSGAFSPLFEEAVAAYEGDDDHDADGVETLATDDQQPPFVKNVSSALSEPASSVVGMNSYNNENSMAQQQLKTELREASTLMASSVTPEAARFWRSHVLDLQARLRATHTDYNSENEGKEESVGEEYAYTAHTSFRQHGGSRTGVDAPSTPIRSAMRSNNVVKNTPTSPPSSADRSLVARVPRAVTFHQQLESTNSMSSDTRLRLKPRIPAYPQAPEEMTRASSPLPIVQVIAPADLPGGYHFEAEIDGRRFLAAVPDGGVEKGEAFACFMRDLEMVGSEIPVGRWRDRLSDCCIHGQFHPLLWNTLLCPLLSLGQVMTRLNFDLCGRPLSARRRKAPFDSMVYVVAFWALMNAAICVAINYKFSRSIALSISDCVAIAIINMTMIVFAIVATMNTRANLRDRFMIREYVCFDLEDFICATCCMPCTICQMARHTADYQHSEAAFCTEHGLKAQTNGSTEGGGEQQSIALVSTGSLGSLKPPFPSVV